MVAIAREWDVWTSRRNMALNEHYELIFPLLEMFECLGTQEDGINFDKAAVPLVNIRGEWKDSQIADKQYIMER